VLPPAGSDDLTLALFNSKKQKKWFFKDSGKKVWGKSFDAEAAIEKLNAEIKKKRRT
jgi:hypothetical protein